VANIPAGIKFAWPSTVATIPAGYTRYAALDGRYARAAASAGGTGGAATHLHSINLHNHTQNSHDHALTVGDSAATHPAPVGLAVTVAQNSTHNHTGDSDGQTGVNFAKAAHNSDSANNDPKNLEVIFVTSDGSAGFPVDAIGWWAAAVASLPGDWDQHPDALDRFLKGAAAAGDGGATSDSHTHTCPAHTHAQDAHVHFVGTIGPDSLATWDIVQTVAYVQATPDPHSHNVNSNSGTATATNQNATPTLNVGITNPTHIDLHAITRAAGGDECPTGLIGIWTGLAGAIPANWFACDGTLGTPDLTGNRLVRSTDTGDPSLATGGGSHSHTSAAHNHTQNSHTHTAGVSLYATAFTNVKEHLNPAQPNCRLVLDYAHTHSVSLSSGTATNQSTAITTATATPTPLYTDVIFVQYQGVPAAAGAGIDSVRVRPADWFLAYSPTDDAEGVRFLNLVDVERTGDTTEHTPDLGAEGGDAPRQAITRLGASLILGFVPASPGAINIGIVDADRFHWKEAAVIAGDYYQVAMDVQHGSTMIVVLGLIDDAGTKRWYQTCGQWDVTAGNFDFETAVECDTLIPGSFPDAKDAGGTLRRVADGSLLFAFIDDADDIHVMRCAAMPADATGTWVEV